MALARVVSFEEVGRERVLERVREIREGDRPDNIPATEMVMLHVAGAESAQRKGSADNAGAKR